MPSSAPAHHDAPVIQLAARYPLFLQDLNNFLQRSPQSAAVRSGAQQAFAFEGSGHDLLIGCPDPAAAARLATSRNDGHRLIHLFTKVGDFVYFLTQPGVMDCIARPNWFPLLLLPLAYATHTQQWLSEISPARWPWILGQHSALSADPDFRHFVGQLSATVDGLARQLTDKLAATHPIPGQCTSGPAGARGRSHRRITVLAFNGSAYQQFCARDMTDALTAEGHETDLLLLDATPAANLELLRAIERFGSDLLLLNGRYRMDFRHLPAALPVLTWDQDWTLPGRSNLAQTMGPSDRVMVMVRDWLDDARRLGLSDERVCHVNLGTNEALYRPRAGPRRAAAPDYDVLFVGNIYSFERYQRMIGFEQMAEPDRRAMLLARERLIAWVDSRDEAEPFVIPADLDVLLRDCYRELKLTTPAAGHEWAWHVTYFRYRIAHHVLRERYVSALASDGFRLGLFGRGWDEFPAMKGIAQPEIANGQPLVELIHRSAINLHLHTWTVHHPRLYDTAAAGGFLLVGRVPESYMLDEVFTVGGELDSFGSIAQMKARVRHYLARPGQRQAMAERAVARVHRDHTMRHRMQEAMAFVTESVHHGGTEGTEKADENEPQMTQISRMKTDVAASRRLVPSPLAGEG